VGIPDIDHFDVGQLFRTAVGVNPGRAATGAASASLANSKARKAIQNVRVGAMLH